MFERKVTTHPDMLRKIGARTTAVHSRQRRTNKDVHAHRIRAPVPERRSPCRSPGLRPAPGGMVRHRGARPCPQPVRHPRLHGTVLAALRASRRRTVDRDRAGCCWHAGRPAALGPVRGDAAPLSTEGTAPHRCMERGSPGCAAPGGCLAGVAGRAVRPAAAPAGLAPARPAGDRCAGAARRRDAAGGRPPVGAGTPGHLLRRAAHHRHLGRLFPQPLQEHPPGLPAQ